MTAKGWAGFTEDDINSAHNDNDTGNEKSKQEKYSLCVLCIYIYSVCGGYEWL